jgi:cytochrome P450
MGELAFGKSFNLIEGENRHLPDLMEEAADYGNFNANALTWFFLGISKVLLPKLEASRTAFLNFVMPFIDRRMKMEDAKKDFFHHLIDAKDPDTGEGFSLPELWGETMVLMVVSLFKFLELFTFGSWALWCYIRKSRISVRDT